jgi:hypothetical protein
MNTHTGKIGRSPRPVQEELNRRLRENEKGRRLVGWLNGLPEVRAVLQAEFGGKAITEGNLTLWRQGGYRVWLARQEDRESAQRLAADAAELAEAGPVAEHFARVLSVRYAAFFARWNGDPASVNRRELATLHTLCEDVTQLRRGEHSAARLQLEREEQAWRSRSGEAEVLRVFLSWIRLPEIKDLLNRPGLSEEEKIRRIRKAFGPMFGVPGTEPDEEEKAAVEKARADQAKAAAEMEKASGTLFRAAPPGLPALAQLDERLKARPENKEHKGGLTKETVALIDKALGIKGQDESAPPTPGGGGRGPEAGPKIQANSSKFEDGKTSPPPESPAAPQSDPKPEDAADADLGHGNRPLEHEARPRRQPPAAPVITLIRSRKPKTAEFDELGL